MNETFNIKEAAAYLHCSISTIRHLVRTKSICFYRIGNRLYFKRLSLEKWVEEQELQSMLDKENETKIKPLNIEEVS